ncbi:MAG: hypothetical protein ABSF37_09185 [Sedimentisphaerales bacterium]|jgi:hypothetical protein
MQAIFSVKTGLPMAGNQPIDDLRLVRRSLPAPASRRQGSSIAIAKVDCGFDTVVRLGIEPRQGKRAAQPIDDMRK